ncbi:hypothetical protein HYPSUDRAFT_71749 [Hypholoma sublateritium FD-334 SS-4]|uniref:Signal peptidase complex subunit 1 n=1 Tax=Hypholoma sublateritium (strain FD-334 SS-4) TaxID=945553 RepID=A0A0D2KMQ0_HYPSF|nr:hypothetical protein HYPSUDRAFT_71749 [Hypholoma sublateritium FD-334 SS-4]
MSAYIQELLEGKIDFDGQAMVDLVSRVTLGAATILAFGLGFALQDLRVTFGIVGAVTVVLALVLLPPWPMFNKHPVKWLPKKSKLQ